MSAGNNADLPGTILQNLHMIRERYHMEKCMNCIILLLLLSCCGGCGGDRGCGNNCRPVRREDRMEDCGCGTGTGRRESGRRESGRRPEPCGCEERRSCREPEPCGCEERRPCREQEPCGCEERRPCREPEPCRCDEREREGCDSPGMIPPPWQEYPKFPRRNDCEDCES